MARRKTDISLVKYFSKLKGIEPDPKISYEDLWDLTVKDTPFDCQCSYHETIKDGCVFTVTNGSDIKQDFKYSFDDCHTSKDPLDLNWNVIFQDALTFMKKNKLIAKIKKSGHGNTRYRKKS